MFIKKCSLVISLSAFMVLGVAFAGEENGFGIEKRTTDTVSTRTDTYKKEVGKTESGKGYGVYGSSTKEYKGDGERDTSANERQGAGSKGGGIYIDY